jgi:hypothetical protein
MTLFYCRSCQERFRRHGSHWHKSYSATELSPYLRAATAWLKAHGDDAWVKHDLAAVAALLEMSGLAEPSTALRGRSPRERARIAIARLRRAGTSPLRILAIALAMSAICKEEPTAPRASEFRAVQVAKAAHRLASGEHRHWEIPRHDGSIVPIELHAYARSTGRVLRHLGKAIEDECSHVLERFIDDVLALKVERYGPHPATVVKQRLVKAI